MGKQQYIEVIQKDAQEDAVLIRERLIHRQLQWLVFWTCIFIAAGAIVGLEPRLEKQSLNGFGSSQKQAEGMDWYLIRGENK